MAEAKQDEVGLVYLTNVRLSFAHLFKPQEGRVDEKTGEKGEPKFNCSFLIPKNTDDGKANLAKVKAAADAVKKKKWGDDIPRLKPEKVCLRDGDLETYDGYEGHYYLTSSNSKQPGLFDRDRSALTADSGKLYSGCYVNAYVRLWAQDNKFGKRLNGSLEAVQFLRHGDAFGYKRVGAEQFEDVSESDDAGSADMDPPAPDDDGSIL